MNDAVRRGSLPVLRVEKYGEWIGGE